MEEESPIKISESEAPEKSISGYEFVQKVIAAHPDDAIAVLLSYAGNDECDFLEFKAGMETKPGTLKPGESPQDLYWNYSREIIAMINSRGGLFVIGISDDNDHHVVPLESNDSGNVIEKEGLEAYFRKVIASHLVPVTRKWVYKGRTFTTEDRIDIYLESRKLNYQGHTIFAYLVKPREDGELISCQSKYKNGDEAPEVVYVRSKGQIGQAKELKTQREINKYKQTREICSLILGSDIQRFIPHMSHGSSGAYRLRQLKEGYTTDDVQHLIAKVKGCHLTNELSPGMTVGGYEVIGKIGEGGMGTVYRVCKPLAQEDVAMKVFKSPGSEDNEPMAKRFITEAFMLKALNHPRVPRLHEISFDKAAGSLFFTMDLIESDDPGVTHTLADYTLSSNHSDLIKIDDTTALKWLQELCELLDHLHQRGIVHRDIKPSNIMIGKDKLIHLTDFGIVKINDQDLQKLVDYDVTLTYTQSFNSSKPLLGTMSYLAPEVRHKKNRPSTKSDVWAVGVTFFKLLSGELFDGQQLERKTWCENHDIWYPIISAMLEHDPEERPTCAEILDIIKILGIIRDLSKESDIIFGKQRKTILNRPITESMVIAGSAGNGKTTIALHKALQLCCSKGDLIYISRHLVTAGFLKTQCEGTSLVKTIMTAGEWRKSGQPSADVLIIDDAQDFTKDEINDFIKHSRLSTIFFGDDVQSLPSSQSQHITLEEIAELVGTSTTKLVTSKSKPTLQGSCNTKSPVQETLSKVILLDGDNIAGAAGHNGILVLYSLVSELKCQGYTVRVYCSPEFTKRPTWNDISERLLRILSGNTALCELIEQPGAVFAMLDDCSTHACQLISNDTYSDYGSVFPWLTTRNIWGNFPISTFVCNDKEFSVPRLGIKFNTQQLGISPRFEQCLYPSWWEADLMSPPHGQLMLILDTSCSMDRWLISALNADLKSMLEKMTSGISSHFIDVEIIAFGNGVSILQQMARVTTGSIPSLQTKGTTPLNDALETAISELSQCQTDKYPTFVCLLTNRVPSQDISPIASSFESFANQNHIKCLGGFIGSQADVAKLQILLPFFDFRQLGVHEIYQYFEMVTDIVRKDTRPLFDKTLVSYREDNHTSST